MCWYLRTCPRGRQYPSVTSGSIASSAPLVAKTNFYEYMEVVGQAVLYFSGQKCYAAIETAANTIAKLASQGMTIVILCYVPTWIILASDVYHTCLVSLEHPADFCVTLYLHCDFSGV